MQYIDIFNGDADGIFALIQWRKAHPVAAECQQLITGVKRDNSLVREVANQQASGASLTILDISFDKNSVDLARVLAHAEHAFYCDHHQAKSLFSHPKLETYIDLSANVCTGLLVSEKLNREYHLWAIAAAFGDGLVSVAEQEAEHLHLTKTEMHGLRELGVLVNYNSYGTELADLHYAPSELYRTLVDYATPLDIVNDSTGPLTRLKQGYAEDLAKALQCEVLENNDIVHAVMLENVAWARRISGAYGNQLAARSPNKAVIVITPNSENSLTISLRAPQSNLRGAGDICALFPTGGGRAGAGGVNALPMTQLEDFISRVHRYYAKGIK